MLDCGWFQVVRLKCTVVKDIPVKSKESANVGIELSCLSAATNPKLNNTLLTT